MIQLSPLSIQQDHGGVQSTSIAGRAQVEYQMLADSGAESEDINVFGGTETSVQSYRCAETLGLIEISVGFDLVVMRLVTDSKQEQIGCSAWTQDAEVVRSDRCVGIYLQLKGELCVAPIEDSAMDSGFEKYDPRGAVEMLA